MKKINEQVSYEDVYAIFHDKPDKFILEHRLTLDSSTYRIVSSIENASHYYSREHANATIREIREDINIESYGIDPNELVACKIRIKQTNEYFIEDGWL